MSDHVFTVRAGQRARTLLDVLRAEGYELASPCGGGGTCGKCRVRIRRYAGACAEDVLACQVAPEVGMEVLLDALEVPTGALEISIGGRVRAAGFAPDVDARGVGLAFDVGTTTLVCRLHDLYTGNVLARAGAPNPQGAFGADVISRISAVADGHLEELRVCVGHELMCLAERVAADAGVSPADIRRAVLCGNTVMECLTAGVDPTSIGAAPFTPPTLFGEAVALSVLQQMGCGVTEALFMPCIAGYVGADITADMLACGMGRTSDTMLLLDLGTNGEMALSTGSGIVTCATAAGPVFEGANIQFGMPAYPGAISRILLSGDELCVETIANAPAQGVCGTGLIDVLALLLRCGVVDESGFMMEADELSRDVPSAVMMRVGEFEGSPAFWITPEVAVTQKDVRSIQLAKAAIAAGIRTLLRESGVSLEDVSRLVVAGGFGQFLDLANATRIGLFPRELLPVAESVGNVAIEGAGLALVSRDACVEAARVADVSTYMELLNSAAFNEAYLEAMEFPEA